MRQDREHLLYHLDAETLLVATYVWVDDELKALQARGFKHPKKQKHQKATLAELLTLAIFLLLQGQDLAKGYLAAKTTLKAYFPSLPHLSRFYRVLQKAGPEGPGRLAEPHTFPPPGGPSPRASPCRVYAERPGDPPQLYAGRPPRQALPGPSPARR